MKRIIVVAATTTAKYGTYAETETDSGRAAQNKITDMTKEEIIEAISDDKMMPYIEPYQLSEIVDFVIKNYKPSLPSDLDEVTMDFARELDFFLYGSYAPERFPNSMQVRDEHSGLKVNDWKCWVNRPELKIEMVKHFFTIGKQAGAEWMAGQGWHDAVETPSIFGVYLLIHEKGWCVANYMGKGVVNESGWVEAIHHVSIDAPQKWFDLRDLIPKKQ